MNGECYLTSQWLLLTKELHGQYKSAIKYSAWNYSRPRAVVINVYLLELVSIIRLNNLCKIRPQQTVRNLQKYFLVSCTRPSLPRSTWPDSSWSRKWSGRANAGCQPQNLSSKASSISCFGFLPSTKHDLLQILQWTAPDLQSTSRIPRHSRETG